jgi:hypothetical protein
MNDNNAELKFRYLELREKGKGEKKYRKQFSSGVWVLGVRNRVFHRNSEELPEPFLLSSRS